MALVEYAQKNDLEGLRRLIDHGPGSINTTDSKGYTALHVAVLHERDDVFNLLVTQKDINLDARTYKDETPLLFAVRKRRDNYARTLLELGAGPNLCDHSGYSPLHGVRSIELAELLIDKGADLDAQTDTYRETPLLSAIRDKRMDIFYLLLYYGADPTIPDKDGETTLTEAMREFKLDVANILLHYYMGTKVPLECFVIAMRFKCAIFHELYDICKEITYTDQTLLNLATNLLSLDANCFEIFIGKFNKCLVAMCRRARHLYKLNNLHYFSIKAVFFIFNILQKCDLLTEFVTAIICRFNDNFLNFDFITSDYLSTLDEKTQLALTLLSHGMPLQFETLCKVYKTYGYCDLFRILLHCDICDTYIPNQRLNLMVALISDVNLSIEHCIEYPQRYIFVKSALALLEQFASWKLQQICLTKFEGYEAIEAKLKALPSLPTLVELSRNATRLHIVNKFKVTCSRHLYTYIESLQISQVYKDILSYKKKLYL